MTTFEDLKKASHFKCEEDTRVFDVGVWEIAQKKDPYDLPKLFELFDDDTEFPEVMFSLIHAIESYPILDETISLLKNIKNSH